MLLQSLQLRALPLGLLPEGPFPVFMLFPRSPYCLTLDIAFCHTFLFSHSAPFKHLPCLMFPNVPLTPKTTFSYKRSPLSDTTAVSPPLLLPHLTLTHWPWAGPELQVGLRGWQVTGMSSNPIQTRPPWLDSQRSKALGKLPCPSGTKLHQTQGTIDWSAQIILYTNKKE